MKRFEEIIGLLLAVGIIFGTFQQWTAETTFGFAWFVDMLWFAIGFPVLFILGWLAYKLGVAGSVKLTKSAEELEKK